MKKIIAIMLLVICSVAFATPDKVETVSLTPHARTKMIYVRYDTDFNDANTCIFKNFYGTIYGYTIDSNGTDESFKVKFYIDPPEGSTAADQVEELHLLMPVKTCTTVTGWYDEVFPWQDASSNVVGGNVKVGDIWVGIEDANDATLDDLVIGLLVDVG
jgi:hypothetical protein